MLYHTGVSQTLPRQAFLRRVAEDPELDQGQQQMPQQQPHQHQPGLPRVQAMYAHTGNGDTQLSFNEVGGPSCSQNHVTQKLIQLYMLS